MSSFQFLTFCVYVFRCLGLHFQPFLFQIRSSGGFLPLPSKPPRGSHTASTGLVCGFAGVVPLSVFNPAHSASQGKFLFCVQNEVTPPPKGGGAGYHLSWVGRVGSVRSKLGHAGSTRPTLFLAGAGPLPGLQNRTQGHTGPSLVLTVFSWCASFAVVPLTGAPGGS